MWNILGQYSRGDLVESLHFLVYASNKDGERILACGQLNCESYVNAERKSYKCAVVRPNCIGMIVLAVWSLRHEMVFLSLTERLNVLLLMLDDAYILWNH